MLEADSLFTLCCQFGPICKFAESEMRGLQVRVQLECVVLCLHFFSCFFFSRFELKSVWTLLHGQEPSPVPFELKVQVQTMLNTLIKREQGMECKKKNEEGTQQNNNQYLMCQNEGACFKPSDQRSYCVCPREYTGILCQFKAFKRLNWWVIQSMFKNWIFPKNKFGSASSWQCLTAGNQTCCFSCSCKVVTHKKPIHKRF